MSAPIPETPVIGAGLDRLRAPIGRAWHAPGYVYSSPEMLAREKENLFMKDWLFVAREEELEKPGDFMTLRILDEPVLLTRAADGTLNAFANVCLHRGVEVASGQGHTKEFMCPYHGWLYGLDGRLVGAPYMKEAEGFDPKSCRLPQLKIDSWAGNVFISFDPNAPPLGQFLETFVADVGFLKPEKCRLANKIALELPCNWKFAVENLMDFYHVGVLHGNSFGAFFSWREENVKLHDKGGVFIKYTSAAPTPEGKTLFRLLPWFEAIGEGHRHGSMAYCAPNLHLFGRPDVVRPIAIWPTGPDSCRMMIYHLFPTEWHTEPYFKEKCKVYRDYQIKVLEEDRSMLVSMQSAMTSRTYRPGPLSHLEAAIHNTVNYLVEKAVGDAAARSGVRAAE